MSGSFFHGPYPTPPSRRRVRSVPTLSATAAAVATYQPVMRRPMPDVTEEEYPLPVRRLLPQAKQQQQQLSPARRPDPTRVESRSPVPPRRRRFQPRTETKQVVTAKQGLITRDYLHPVEPYDYTLLNDRRSRFVTWQKAAVQERPAHLKVTNFLTYDVAVSHLPTFDLKVSNALTCDLKVTYEQL